ncbi:hypothetical protein F7Q99_13780 [Streptomyces kaniharaensis]|uniref:Uncharacterized protein n=1 Tax=Streptomyces kaniharaensis TaxID=212423 RepID=A0A6N7KRV3_9ACTN|nr:hypothetical protein [Streptomyces kaniharaensis]MQS13319.1 hypothetical protein [Streptomyces kaniharaensis]
MPENPARDGLLPATGTLAVSPADLFAHAGTVDELHAGFTAADGTAREHTTAARAALDGWRTGPELRTRAARWEDQVAALGGILHELAHRLRTTGARYAATESALTGEE